MRLRKGVVLEHFEDGSSCGNAEDGGSTMNAEGAQCYQEDCICDNSGAANTYDAAQAQI